jgi:hypothetical protein
MNRKVSLGFLAVILCGALFFLAYSGAAAGRGEPGSPDDPVVTKSFVEEYVRQHAGGGFGWEIANLEAGQVFVGQAGTEFILRSGRATVVDPTGSGIPDLTNGTNLTNGSSVPANRLCLVPRSDGRGLKASSAVIIMHRGGFDLR